MRFESRSGLLAWVCLAIPTLLASPARSNPQSAEVLFPHEGVRRPLVSPSGEWIVAIAHLRGRSGLLVQQVGRSVVEPVMATEDELSDVFWVGRNVVMAEFYASTGRRFLVARFREELGAVAFETSWIDAPGMLVDPRPLVDEEVIWATNRKGRAYLHRATLEELEGFGDKKDVRGRSELVGKELADIKGSGSNWIVDRKGNPRAMLRADDERYEILVRETPRSALAFRYGFAAADEADYVIPLGLSADEKQLLVKAYAGNDTQGVHEFDLKTGQFGAAIFVRPDVDVQGLISDPVTGEPMAVHYEADGRRKFHYLSPDATRVLGTLEEDFPLESVLLVSISADRRFIVFFVVSPTNPGVYYLRDLTKEETLLIARMGGGIDQSRLSPTDHFVVESADGTEVEAFITPPRSQSGQPAPLIVMPHGGPRAVRDNREYDSLVQYLASWGFAVLEVNYRGSAGYGRAFLDSGKKQWAKRIEDDIDAAVEHAMERPDVDGARICIVGSSYGGFSSLASVVRHKDRYACAVSWNGVSDIPLLYDSSDIADSRRSLEYYEKYVGDLETEREKLIEASPAYHADRIETPILFIYGTEDRRVDPDHSHRMMLMLDLYGKEWEALEVEGMGHGANRRERIIVSRGIRRFVSRSLEPDRDYRPDPAVDSDPLPTFLRGPRVDR